MKKYIVPIIAIASISLLFVVKSNKQAPEPKVMINDAQWVISIKPDSMPRVDLDTAVLLRNIYWNYTPILAGHIVGLDSIKTK